MCGADHTTEPCLFPGWLDPHVPLLLYVTLANLPNQRIAFISPSASNTSPDAVVPHALDGLVSAMYDAAGTRVGDDPTSIRNPCL